MSDDFDLDMDAPEFWEHQYDQFWRGEQRQDAQARPESDEDRQRRQARHEENERLQQQQRIQEIRKQRREEWCSQIPELLRPDYEMQPEVAAWAADLAQRRPPGNLVLAGGYGLGKTHNALHAVLRAYDSEFCGTAVYVHPERWRKFSPVSQFEKADAGLFRKFREAVLLVLDDLPGKLRAFHGADWERLYMIIDERCGQRGKPVVLISNVADLKEALGAAVSDRLRQPKVTVVTYTGESFRGTR